MARDRLANLRQGQGYGGSQGYGGYSNDYPSQPPSAPQAASYTQMNDAYDQRGAGPGYGGGASSRYGGSGVGGGGTTQQQQPYTSVDMGAGNSMQANGSASAQDDESAFFADIREIQQATKDLNENISRIQELHARSLDTLANDAQHNQINSQLSQLTDDTRQLSNSLKGAIKRLESQTAKKDPRDPNTNVRRTQCGAVKNRFMEAIQRYQIVEQESRKKQRQKMERQFKIVKPDASPEEVQQVLDSSNQGTQMFQQALLNSNRYGDARAAYREVQDRHAEILKIEQTITELAQMFNDMAVMVEDQDPQLQAVEVKAQEAETDMHQAEGQMQQAVKSARAARKKRWICFGVFVVILIIVAIVLAVHFTSGSGGDNNNNNGNTSA